jgi:hypothetical protein
MRASEDGFASSATRQRVLLGELGHGFVDSACAQCAERDAIVSVFHGMEYTPLHYRISNTLVAS